MLCVWFLFSIFISCVPRVYGDEVHFQAPNLLILDESSSSSSKSVSPYDISVQISPNQCSDQWFGEICLVSPYSIHKINTKHHDLTPTHIQNLNHLLNSIKHNINFKGASYHQKKNTLYIAIENMKNTIECNRQTNFFHLALKNIYYLHSCKNLVHGSITPQTFACNATHVQLNNNSLFTIFNPKLPQANRYRAPAFAPPEGNHLAIAPMLINYPPWQDDVIGLIVSTMKIMLNHVPGLRYTDKFHDAEKLAYNLASTRLVDFFVTRLDDENITYWTEISPRAIARQYHRNNKPKEQQQQQQASGSFSVGAPRSTKETILMEKLLFILYSGSKYRLTSGEILALMGYSAADLEAICNNNNNIDSTVRRLGSSMSDSLVELIENYDVKGVYQQGVVLGKSYGGVVESQGVERSNFVQKLKSEKSVVVSPEMLLDKHSPTPPLLWGADWVLLSLVSFLLLVLIIGCCANRSSSIELKEYMRRKALNKQALQEKKEKKKREAAVAATAASSASSSVSPTTADFLRGDSSATSLQLLRSS